MTSKRKRVRYNPEMLPIVREMVAEQKTNVEIAKVLGVSPGTISCWIRDKPEFKEAIRPLPKLPRKKAEKYKFEPGMLLTAREMAEKKKTDEEIAEALGVTIGTITRWIKENPDFRRAIMGDAKRRNGPGRPDGYRPQMAERAHKMATLGLTNERIADIIGISMESFHQYKNRHKDFAEAISSAREESDANVAVSLRTKALGYTRVEQRSLVGKDGSVTTIEEEKYYPPDTSSIIFWLKNRQPDLWRDRRDVTAEVKKVLNVINGEAMSEEDWAKEHAEDEEDQGDD